MILICGHEDTQPLILLSCHLLYFNVSSCKGHGKLTSLALLPFNVHLLNPLNFKRIWVSLCVKSIKKTLCLATRIWNWIYLTFQSLIYLSVSHNIPGCCFSQQPAIFKLALLAVWFTNQCYYLLKLDAQTFVASISAWITYLLLCNLLPQT